MPRRMIGLTGGLAHGDAALDLQSGPESVVDVAIDFDFSKISAAKYRRRSSEYGSIKVF